VHILGSTSPVVDPRPTLFDVELVAIENLLNNG
jgi:hypothetical protein